MKLNQQECISYYCNQAKNQRGRGIFIGPPIQRGYGIFGDLFRQTIPILKDAGKYLGKKALNLTKDIGTDVLSGKSVKDSIKSRLKDVGSEIKSDVIRKIQSGEGIKRKYSRIKHQRRKRNEEIYSINNG